MSAMGIVEIAGVECSERLLAHDYFSDVAVLCEDRGVVDSDVRVALSSFNERGGKMGACVVVLSPNEEPQDQDAPGPQCRIIVTARVIERPLVNRDEASGGTGKRWSAIGDQVKALLHHFRIGSATLAFDGMDIGVDEENSGDVIREYHFALRAGVAAIPKVPTPNIATSGPVAIVIVNVPSPDSQIYYTTDGSYPRPGGDTSMLFTVAFGVEPGTTVRAAAYLAGSQGSDVAEKIFN